MSNLGLGSKNITTTIISHVSELKDTNIGLCSIYIILAIMIICMVCIFPFCVKKYDRTITYIKTLNYDEYG